MKTKSKPCIALTIGDPAGVGPEIALRALSQRKILSLADFILVGDEKVLEWVRSDLCLKVKWKTFDESAAAPCAGISLYDPCHAFKKIPKPGKWSKATGAASLEYVNRAIDLCLDKTVQAVVTGPICKAAWKAAGDKHPGHTELLQDRAGSDKVVMMLAGCGLRVALATIHEPLKKVPKLLSEERIVSTGKILGDDLKKYFGLKRPKVAVLGLNPHAGESGHMGTEEENIITPAIKKLRRMKIDAVGPLPADTAFHYAMRGAYDAVLAMYHDQGLGPLKTVAFDSGVNITLGLPIIRTSVDHGTAFDIAGKGIASETSMAEAIKCAVEMCAGKNKKRR